VARPLAFFVLVLACAGCAGGPRCGAVAAQNAAAARSAFDAWLAKSCGAGASVQLESLPLDQVREQLQDDGRWFPLNAAMPPGGAHRYRDARGRELVGYHEGVAFGCGTERTNAAFVQCRDGRVGVYHAYPRREGTCEEAPPHREREARDHHPCDPGTRHVIWRLPVQREDQVFEGTFEVPTIQVVPP
jgi:hypothetical protein